MLRISRRFDFAQRRRQDRRNCDRVLPLRPRPPPRLREAHESCRSRSTSLPIAAMERRGHAGPSPRCRARSAWARRPSGDTSRLPSSRRPGSDMRIGRQSPRSSWIAGIARALRVTCRQVVPRRRAGRRAYARGFRGNSARSTECSPRRYPLQKDEREMRSRSSLRVRAGNSHRRQLAQPIPHRHPWLPAHLSPGRPPSTNASREVEVVVDSAAAFTSAASATSVSSRPESAAREICGPRPAGSVAA